jgi:hypothetical protein
VRHARARRELRQEKSGNKEAVIGQLDNSDFPIRVYTDNFESSGKDPVPIPGIQAIIAAELLDDFLFSIRLVGQCARHGPYRLRLADKRAGQFADYQVWRIGGGFFVLGVADSQHISCILYQSMLKAPSGRHEGPAAFAGKSDGAQRPAHAFVRAARSAPKSVKLLQYRLIALVIQ